MKRACVIGAGFGGLALAIRLQSAGIATTLVEEQLAAAATSKGRVSVFATPDWRECATPGYGERLSAGLAQAKRLGAVGLKISKGLGLGYPGGPALERLAEKERSEDRVMIDTRRCYGCGLCRAECTHDAITLRPRFSNTGSEADSGSTSPST